MEMPNDAMAGERATKEVALARIRDEIDAIRASVDVLEQQLSRLAEDPSSRSERARPERYYHVLIEVYERGPHGISAEELGEVAREHGYDRRGLNGYFAGTRAPLRIDGGRVQLTLEGRRLVTQRLRTQASG